MTRLSSRFAAATVLGATTVLFVGCSGTPERPVAEMARARALIEQANQAGAQQFAAADLNRAREKLEEADKAAKEGDEPKAWRFSLEAAADAELASAKVRQAKAEQGADEVARSLETLRKETGRDSRGQQR